MITTPTPTIEDLRAENLALKAKLGLEGDGAVPRDTLFKEIARSLFLPDDAIRAVTKYGHEDSTVRILFLIDGQERPLDCPVRKLAQVTHARGLVADVCDRVLEYRQNQWNRIANMILSAAEKVAGSTRDSETVEWVAAFAQRACTGFHGVQYGRPITDGAEIYDRLINARCRRAGVLEASHTGDVLFLRRPDGGISIGQADFMGFVWSQQGYRLSRAELDQRLAAIGFQKAPLSARKGSQVAKLKACWHSPPAWLQEQDVDLPESASSQGINGKEKGRAPCGP